MSLSARASVSPVSTGVPIISVSPSHGLFVLWVRCVTFAVRSACCNALSAIVVYGAFPRWRCDSVRETVVQRYILVSHVSHRWRAYLTLLGY